MIPHPLSSSSLPPSSPIPSLASSKSLSYPCISPPPHFFIPPRSSSLCFSKSSKHSLTHVESVGHVNAAPGVEESEANLHLQVGNQILPSFLHSSTPISSANQAFFLLSFVACTTSVAFTSLVIATIPTLNAMRRAAISLSRLADVAREELPGTMASIRLSGMEISDLTLELSDLSQEISDGVKKSAQAVQAAEAGVRQIGALAHERTMKMIEERGSLPVISLQPVVAGAAKKTSNAVGQATKTLINMISRGEFRSQTEGEDPDGFERLDI